MTHCHVPHSSLVLPHAGVDVVVATPGRLLHLNEEGTLHLDRVSYLVVDEADRFMQGSLEEELRKVYT